MDRVFRKTKRSTESATAFNPHPERSPIRMRMPELRIDRSALSSGEPVVHDFQVEHDHSRRQTTIQPIRADKRPHLLSSPDLAPVEVPAFSSDSEDEAPPPPNFSSRPTQLMRPRSSSSMVHTPPHNREEHYRPSSSAGHTSLDKYDRSSVESRYSIDTTSSSIQNLPSLQAKGLPDDADRLQPVLEDDPANFDLVSAPPEQTTGIYQLEHRAEQLLSSKHLELIFSEPRSLLKFTTFLSSYRPQSIPILIFYLDALKAIRAITYANAISEALEPIKGFSFTDQAPPITQNSALEEKATKAFEVLAREDLPAYIVHVWIQVVSVSIQRRITGTLAPHLREASEGLAEVFCLTDPSRHDNPIVFASEEFHRTTQYGMSYAIGRNCRFLQGPKTNPNSVRRLADACKNNKEHSEVFVNYRRDGSPFMNLLMVAPLFDSKGNLRYFIGAQVDVSGLLRESTGTELDEFARLVAREEDPQFAAEEDRDNQKDELQNLSEMFNVGELDTVKNHGGRMHRDQVDDSDRDSISSHRPRLLLKDPGSEPFIQPQGNANTISMDSTRLNGRLEGVYQNYLLIRPAPSLRILFTSPSLRVPGILQSPFLSRIGGSSRVRADLAQALSEGRGVTAKVRWLTKMDEDGEGEGRTRWIHCTPLYGHAGSVGVWMVVLVDEEGSSSSEGRRRFRQAPPIASSIGGKVYDPKATREKREREKAKSDRMLPSIDPGRARTPDGYGDFTTEVTATSSRFRPSQHVASLEKRTPSMLSGRGGAQSELSFQLK